MCPEDMNIEQRIKDIVSYHSGTAIESLSLDTRIEEDLGATGDDAWELIEDVRKEFGIDFSSFDFLKHFSPEAGFASHPDYGYYPITVRHLVEVALSKAWFLPPISEGNFSRERARRLNTSLFLVGTVILILVLVT